MLPNEKNTVALDCEFVATGYEIDTLARVGVVDYYGNVLLDLMSEPVARITNYREEITGLDSSYLKKAKPFEVTKRLVSEMIENKYVVGHGIMKDLAVLMIEHPRYLIIDTHYNQLLINMASRCGVKSRTNNSFSLKLLSKFILGNDIQEGVHCPIEDARQAMLLYRKIEQVNTELLKKMSS